MNKYLDFQTMTFVSYNNKSTPVKSAFNIILSNISKIKKIFDE